MENLQQYQLNKTLRFGLTLKKNSINKITGKPNKNPSHQILKDSVDDSIKIVQKQCKSKIKHEETTLVRDVASCLLQIKSYLNDWKTIYLRTDQLAFTEEYYKQIAKKARFDPFWEYKGKKQPASQEIKLSALTRDKRQDKILHYWYDNISSFEQKLHELELVTKQFQKALRYNDKAHTKPNLINFRKMFLSVANICNETLIPLCNGNICFPNLEKSSNKNDVVIKFATTGQRRERSVLLSDVKKLQDYFADNGGYVPFGKVTLNKFTTGQKPENFKQEIEDLIEELGIIELLNQLISKSDEEIEEYFTFKEKDKKDLMKSSSISVIERVQYFKAKQIPVSVRYALAEYLHKNNNLNKDKVLKIFETIGTPISVGEYTNKEDFNLNKFPLKLAFDYAWENTARSINNEVNFPKEKCEAFLQIFGVDTANNEFKLYANLQFMKDNLATLEHEQNKPNEPKFYIDNINKAFKSIEKNIEKEHEKYIKSIKNWIAKTPEEQETSKGNNDYKQYQNAKQKLGLLRGGLKNKISAYKTLTETFKKLASTFGKDFANLRDKLREENELNKITYFSVIVEDANRDKYLLMKKLDENRTEKIDSFLNNQTNANDDLICYQVKSFTSKALGKIIKNKGGYKDFYKCDIRSDKKNKEWNDEKEDPRNYLMNSTMATNQKWSDFNWDFSECDTYEKIEKEIDKKGHCLTETKISKQQIEGLIKENWLLLPIVNQDITSKEGKLKNQFSKDWAMIFNKEKKEYRLHPEFKIVYRHPTPDYPANKRYSRFQMIANFMMEVIPQDVDYLSRKQQTQLFNNKENQTVAVQEFNQSVIENTKNTEYVIFGIDRGLKQLATLCVLNKDGQIQGGFEIYTRSFDSDAKQWNHTLLLEKRNILDISNLKVETTIKGEKVLVDLNEVGVYERDAKGIPIIENGNRKTKDNQQKIKLKQLAYIRKLQYQMQTQEEKVLNFINKYCVENTNKEQDFDMLQKTIENFKQKTPTLKEIKEVFKDLIRHYKEGENYADLPLESIFDMLLQFKSLVANNDEKGKIKLCELAFAEDLKRGVVGNMIGVIVYLLEKYNYKVFISLENLCRSFGYAKDGLSSAEIDNKGDFKDQENLALAGLGTYHFFEIQLLKKLLKIQQEKSDLNLIPAFRSTDNYEQIVKNTKDKSNEYVNFPFGIVVFVDPSYTSKKCPICDKTDVNRNYKNANILKCKVCGFVSLWSVEQYENKKGESETHFNENQVQKFIINNNNKIKEHITDKNYNINGQNLNLNMIHNGDDNGAYHIAKKTLVNLCKSYKH